MEIMAESPKKRPWPRPSLIAMGSRYSGGLTGGTGGTGEALCGGEMLSTKIPDPAETTDPTTACVNYYGPGNGAS